VRLPGDHLGRRFFSSLSRRPPGEDDERWAEHWLLPTEVELWRRMTNADRRHAIAVARRFADRRPRATRAEMAGALLHDVGKVESGLGTLARVAATVAGPRTARFRTYHDHESIGARLAEAAGSDPATVALIEGAGPAAADLRAADDL
jgi:HD domain